MADYRAQARRAAARYGLDPDVFERQIQQESGFNPSARSGAGAIGIAQIMPATAQGWGVDPTNPVQSLDAAAKNMARYVKQFGSYKNALVAYNAGPGRVGKPLFSETANYVRTILGGKNPTTKTALEVDASPVPNEAFVALPPLTLPERPRVQVTAPTAPAFVRKRAPLAGAWPETSFTPPQRVDVRKALLTLATEPQTAQTPVTKTGTGTAQTGSLKPGGDWGGTTKPLVGLSQLAHSFGLQTTSAKRPTQMTASGNVSDHYAGNKTANARDLSGTVAQMDSAAVALAKKLGIPYKKGQRLEQTVVKDGIRYQILYRTKTGGDHFTHIHVGAKRV